MTRTRYAAVLFCLLLSIYGYFLPKDGEWVANSRASLTYAIVDQGVLYIDAYHANTEDKAFFEGHYYTVGSIGPSLVALPVYAAYRLFASLAPVHDFLARPPLDPYETAYSTRYQRWAINLMTLVAISVPSALLAVLVFAMAARFTIRDGDAFLLALTYGIGTVAFPYSGIFYQHQVSAFGLFAGFTLCWRVVRENGQLRLLWLAGLLFGLAIISEYPTIIGVTLISLWTLAELRDRRAIVRVVLGALPPLLLFAAYNLTIFHTPLPVSYRYHVANAGVHGQGFMGMSDFSPLALLGITVTPYRGLFFISPVLLLALPGLWWTWRSGARSLALLVLGLVVGFFGYNAAYAVWWGGWTVGPRYLVPLLPFFVLPLAYVLNRWSAPAPGRLVYLVLLVLSVLNVTLQTISTQYWPPETVINPLFDYSLPAFLQGDIAYNYGSLIGLHGHASLLPLLAGIAVITLWGFAPLLLRRDTVREAQHETA